MTKNLALFCFISFYYFVISFVVNTIVKLLIIITDGDIKILAFVGLLAFIIVVSIPIAKAIKTHKVVKEDVIFALIAFFAYLVSKSLFYETVAFFFHLVTSFYIAKGLRFHNFSFLNFSKKKDKFAVVDTEVVE